MNRMLQYVADKMQGKPESLRSPKWDKVRHEHLIKEPYCQWCGSFKNLNVHHCVPFSDPILGKKLELEDFNLISLCKNCHLSVGHFCNYKLNNPMVKKTCAEYSKVK
jgi:5-methylcytosine-specific restriction endonuclease McrA